MSERYAFPLRYDENFVRSCAWGFVVRALFRENAALTFAPLALIAFSCTMLFFSGDEELAVELLIGAFLILAIFVASGWRMHLRMLRGKVETMKGRWPMARLYDDGVSIEGPGQAITLEWWPRIKAIWPVESAWLLILDTNHFSPCRLPEPPRRRSTSYARMSRRALHDPSWNRRWLPPAAAATVLSADAARPPPGRLAGRAEGRVAGRATGCEAGRRQRDRRQG
jgi:hypothetical protein